MKSKQVGSLNVRAKTLGKKNVGINFHDLGLIRQWFLRHNTRNTTKKKLDKFDFIKIKSICASKVTVRKRQ